MKNTIIKLLVVATCVVSITAQAQQQKNREGVSSEIKAEMIKGVESWVNNMKQDLERAIVHTQKAPIVGHEKAYRAAIEDVLSNADKTSSEFLSRNILYRAQEVHNVLITIPKDPKRNAFARRFLKESILWAIKLAPRDIVLAKQADFEGLKGTKDRAILGIMWAKWLISYSFMLPTNEAHFIVLKKAMGFLYNDILNDDQYNRRLANIAKQFLLKYNELKKTEPGTPLETLEMIKSLREFLSEELGIASRDLKVTDTEEEALVAQGSGIPVMATVAASDKSSPTIEYAPVSNAKLVNGVWPATTRTQIKAGDRDLYF